MERDHSHCQDRLSEYLDELLGPDEQREVAEHLVACPACAEVAEGLAAVRNQARALGPLAPPADLWTRIHHRLDEADVVPLTVAGTAGPRPLWRRTVRLTVPQVAAAGLALMLAAGGGAWTLRPLAGPHLDASAAPAGVSALPEGVRDRLDPNTVRILEKNLGVVERAVAEARSALEVEPGNAFLKEYLRAALERREQYLADTRSLLERSS